MSTALNFMPIPLVQSAKLAQLPKYLQKDGAPGDHNLDGVIAFQSLLDLGCFFFVFLDVSKIGFR